MDTESLLSIKSLPECSIFDETILNNIKSYFKESNIKYVKKNKKTTNVLKNSNFNLKKNKINNKIIFILNKLSETNLNNIVIEFIKNIKIDDIESYDNIQAIIFDKILKDSKFIEIYCEFFIIIIKYINSKLNYEPNKLLNIVDCFIQDFSNKKENDRLMFLKFLTNMIKNNFFNNDIVDYILDHLIKHKMVPDLKYWFENYDMDKNKLKDMNLENTRDKLMLESIFENKNVNINDSDIQVKKKNNEDVFLTQCENIIEEYNYLNLNEEIKYFIENECNCNNNKSRFIEYILKQYISKKKNNLFQLFEYIISKNIIDLQIIKNVLIKKNKNNGEIKKLISSLKKNNINIIV